MLFILRVSKLARRNKLPNPLNETGNSNKIISLSKKKKIIQDKTNRDKHILRSQKVFLKINKKQKKIENYSNILKNNIEAEIKIFNKPENPLNRVGIAYKIAENIRNTKKNEIIKPIISPLISVEGFKNNTSNLENPFTEKELKNINSYLLLQSLDKSDDISKKTFIITSLQKVIPVGSYIFPFGSSVSQISSSGEDLDLTVLLNIEDSKSSHIECLKNIGLRLTEFLTQVSYTIMPLRIPLLKLYMFRKHIGDITINNPKGIINTTMFKALRDLNSSVVIAARILKKWAKAKSINNRATGSFSTYALMLMLFHVVMTRKKALLPSFQDLLLKEDIYEEKFYTIIPWNIGEPLLYKKKQINLPNYKKRNKQVLLDILHKQNENQKLKDTICPISLGREKSIELQGLDSYMVESPYGILLDFFTYYSQEQMEKGIEIDALDNSWKSADTFSVICPVARTDCIHLRAGMKQQIFKKIRNAHKYLKSGNIKLIKKLFEKESFRSADILVAKRNEE